VLRLLSVSRWHRPCAASLRSQQHDDQ
jgi:hypothetical protein